MTELPLFPLSGVLLPYGRMPLQIFEPRYLDLVKDSMKAATPFGVVWIRHGEEVAEQGRAAPELGDYGTCARIVDWDQLPNGLLGITIEGGECFDLYEITTRPNGLVVGKVALRPHIGACRMVERWMRLVDVLRSLEAHPHVQRLNLRVDYNDAWQVGYSLVQMLPMDEALKYALLGLDGIDELMAELHALLNQISGDS
ncbi:MAG: LON peptidase substrate-binding domain-containing protein [Halioglobus sp.]|nr:LON peptidase substrate-binding domain-containing protein [Halioglobus sp.]